MVEDTSCSSAPDGCTETGADEDGMNHALGTLASEAEEMAEEPLDDEAHMNHALGMMADEKSKGNEAFARGDHEEALKCWSKSLMSVKYVVDTNFMDLDSDAVRLQDLQQKELVLWLNMAQGNLKRQSWGEAVRYSNLVLDRDESNTKALYRKASGLVGRAAYDEAHATLETLLKLEPDNKAAQALMAQAQRGIQSIQKKAKRLSQRMLSGMDRDHRVPPTWREWALTLFWTMVWTVPSEAVRMVWTFPVHCRDFGFSVRYRTRRRLMGFTQRARNGLEALAPSACPRRNNREDSTESVSSSKAADSARGRIDNCDDAASDSASDS